MPENKLNQNGGIIYGINEFEEKIRSGAVSDRKGKAELLIDGSLYNTYTVHIDRKIVSSSGKVVSFYALLKEYGAESIKIRYTEKELSIEKILTIQEIRRKKKNDKGDLPKKYWNFRNRGVKIG